MGLKRVTSGWTEDWVVGSVPAVAVGWTVTSYVSAAAFRSCWCGSVGRTIRWVVGSGVEVGVEASVSVASCDNVFVSVSHVVSGPSFAGGHVHRMFVGDQRWCLCWLGCYLYDYYC